MIPSQIKTCGKLTGQKGSTLTGLMIGLLVGLLTLAAMYSIFSQNQSVDKFVRDNNFDAQQKIRSLTTLIQMHIVLSGYVEPPINQAVTSSYRFIELGNNDPLSGENNILLEDDSFELNCVLEESGTSTERKTYTGSGSRCFACSANSYQNYIRIF